MIPISISHPVSARDTNISQRAEGPRADIGLGRGLIQGLIWKWVCFIMFITDLVHLHVCIELQVLGNVLLKLTQAYNCAKVVVFL